MPVNHRDHSRVDASQSVRDALLREGGRARAVRFVSTLVPFGRSARTLEKGTPSTAEFEGWLYVTSNRSMCSPGAVTRHVSEATALRRATSRIELMTVKQRRTAKMSDAIGSAYVLQTCHSTAGKIERARATSSCMRSISTL